MSNNLPYGADTLVIPFTWVNRQHSSPENVNRWSGDAEPMMESLPEPTTRSQNTRSHVAPGADSSLISSASGPNAAPVGSEPQGETIVLLPNGKLPTDAEGHSIRIPTPKADLSEVARAGRDAGATYAAGLASGYEGAVPMFYGEMSAALAPGGRFDYQRSGNQIIGLLLGNFEHHNRYVNVSNVNVGLWLQQAGYTLEEALRLAGDYSKRFSGQTTRRTDYGLTEEQQKYTILGWRLGESGAYGPANRLK